MLVLLLKIKKLTNEHEQTKYPNLVTYDAIRALYTLRYYIDTFLSTHLNKFHMRLEVEEEVTGCI